MSNTLNSFLVENYTRRLRQVSYVHANVNVELEPKLNVRGRMETVVYAELRLVGCWSVELRDVSFA